MNFFYIVLVFFLGASFGSFVNVLIDRSVQGREWVRGRSRCDYCHIILRWYDLVPLLSYLIYRGRSRCCGRQLSLRHPIVEGLFGTLFLWWLLVGFVFFRLASAPLTFVQPVFWLVIGVILLAVALADWLYGVIMMTGVWLGVAWVLGYRVVLVLFGVYNPRDFWLGIFGAALAFLFLWGLRALTRGRGMGDGDPYLIFLTSLTVGYARAGWAGLAAFVLGAVVGVILLLTGLKKRQETVPFGPFIVAGALLSLIVT